MRTEANKLPKDNVWKINNASDHKNIQKVKKQSIAKKWSMQLYSKSSKAIEFIYQFTNQDICVPQKKRKPYWFGKT